MRKYIADIITFMRIPVSFILLFTEPLSFCFWIIYIVCGLSDIADGYIARRLKIQSEFGGKLDSVADIVFVAIVAFVIIRSVTFPLEFLVMAIIVLIIRIGSCTVGFFRFHKFISLHTLLNKITGIMLFVSPILYKMIGLRYTGVIAFIVAFLSSIDELFRIINFKGDNVVGNVSLKKGTINSKKGG